MAKGHAGSGNKKVGSYVGEALQMVKVLGGLSDGFHPSVSVCIYICCICVSVCATISKVPIYKIVLLLLRRKLV